MPKTNARVVPGQHTVAALIERLREMPDDAPVMVAAETGPGQASSARTVVFEHGHVWITGDEPAKPAPTPCETCGTSFEECTERIHEGRPACCRGCYAVDTHGMSAAGVL